jgi:hypothetical protein
MVQFVSLKSQQVSQSHSETTLAGDLNSAGHILLGLERVLAQHDQSAYDRMARELLNPATPAPVIEISRITAHSLKDVGESNPPSYLLFTPPPAFFRSSELVGSMDPYVELDCYTTDPSSPWWSYQTLVNEGAGKASEWQIDQTIAFPFLASSSSSQAITPETSSLRVRVKDRNTLKKDVIIGKGVLSCHDLTRSGEWKEFSLQMKNKKGKPSGNIILTARLQLPSLNQSLDETGSIKTIILVSIRSTAWSHTVTSPSLSKERVNTLCAKYGVSCELSDLLEEGKGKSVGEGKIVLELSLMNERAEQEGRGVTEKGFLRLLQCVAELERLEPSPAPSPSSSAAIPPTVGAVATAPVSVMV